MLPIEVSIVILIEVVIIIIALFAYHKIKSNLLNKHIEITKKQLAEQDKHLDKISQVLSEMEEFVDEKKNDDGAR